MPIFTGTSGDDDIVGTADADTIDGGAGADTLDGAGGGDLILAGDGADVINYAPTSLTDSLTVDGGTSMDTLNVTPPADGAPWNFAFDLPVFFGHADLAFTQGTDAIDIDSVNVENINIEADNLGAADFTLPGTGDYVIATLIGTQTIIEGINLPTVALNNFAADASLTITTGDGDDTIDVTRLASVRGTAPHAQVINSGGGADILKVANSTVFAGDGDDVINWYVKLSQGNVIDGGAGSDTQNLFFGGATDRATLTASDGHVLEDLNGFAQDVVGVETINIATYDRADTVTVGDLTVTDVKAVNIDLSATAGGPDGAVDTVTLNAPFAALVTTTPGADGSSEQISLSGAGGIVESVDITALDATDLIKLNGSDGDDTFVPSLLGAPAQLAIDGGAGNDFLLGGASVDSLSGGAGADRIYFGSNDVADGGIGSDTLVIDYQYSGNQAATNAAVFGGDGADSIIGQGVNETLDGGQGEDTITSYGLEPDLAFPNATSSDGTQIHGGDGNDLITGASVSWETITGDAGDDTISGGSLELIDGGTGNDLLDALNGTLLGGQGDDTITADSEILLINNMLEVVQGGDIIGGGDGNDSIVGSGGAETVSGDDGNDFINGNGGADSIDGGDGNDGISAGENSFVSGGEGDDQISGLGNDTLNGDAGADQFTVSGFGSHFNGGADDDSFRWTTPFDDSVNYAVIDGGTGVNSIKISPSLAGVDWTLGVGDYGGLNLHFWISKGPNGDIDVAQFDTTNIQNIELDGLNKADRFNTGGEAVWGVKSVTTDLGTFFGTNDPDRVVDKVFISDPNGPSEHLVATQSATGDLVLATDLQTRIIRHFDPFDQIQLFSGNQSDILDFSSLSSQSETKLVIDAGGGDDTIVGPSFGDYFNESNATELVGGFGNDSIVGGAGKNFIAGGAGDDTLTATTTQAGYIMTPGDGNDVIINFHNSNDVIYLVGFQDRSYSDLVSNHHLIQYKADVLIIEGDATITIKDMDLSVMQHAAYFSFSMPSDILDLGF